MHAARMRCQRLKGGRARLGFRSCQQRWWSWGSLHPSSHCWGHQLDFRAISAPLEAHKVGAQLDPVPCWQARCSKQRCQLRQSLFHHRLSWRAGQASIREDML